MTAQGTIDSAVQTMRVGAYDYITKPIDTNRLHTILQKAGELLGTKVELESRAASCAIPARSAPSSVPPRKCRKSSA